MEEAYTSFTKSIGTTFYVAPEVRSPGRGQYNEKADASITPAVHAVDLLTKCELQMYSLGIIFFEMCVPMMTGMERAETLRRLREEEHILPPIFKLSEKSTQGSIISCLVNHDHSRRPSSAELLASEQIPGEVESDKWNRNVLRRIHEASYRKKLLEGLFQKPEEIEMSRSRPHEPHQAPLTESDMLDPYDDRHFEPRLRPQELTYDTYDRSNSVDDLLLRRLVRDKVTSIFHHHGAISVDGPAILPFSSYYLGRYDQVVKLLSSNDDFLQLPFDHILPKARSIAKAARSPRKTYTFGDVYRDVESGAPLRIGAANFDIISYNSLENALREAEVMKVIDEIIDGFPSMASLSMCYYINHSGLFNAVLAFCKIHPSKWAVVKDTLGTLQGGQSKWSRIRATLRTPAIGVAATSVEELMRFDFRDSCDKAIPKLRTLLNNETLESVFSHMRDLTHYLKGYGVSRKVFISPLSSVNESFYRSHLFFQCIFDSPKKEIFAAGGRYDQLIKAQIPAHQPKSARGEPGAVGLSFNWERLCASMARYQKANAKVKSRRKANIEALDFRIPTRCEVLVDGSDRDLLRSTGIDVIQGLWYGFAYLHIPPSSWSRFERHSSESLHQRKHVLDFPTDLDVNADSDNLARANDISAELIIDTDVDEANSVYNSANEQEYHGWIVYIKQDDNLRVRNVVKKEETEIRVSELFVWCVFIFLVQTDLFYIRERRMNNVQQLRVTVQESSTLTCFCGQPVRRAWALIYCNVSWCLALPLLNIHQESTKFDANRKITIGCATNYENAVD